MSVLRSRNHARCLGDGVAVELLVGARAVAPREIASHARELQSCPQRRIGPCRQCAPRRPDQRRGIAAEQLVERKYLEQLNEAYSQFFHFYDEAPPLIVNAAAIDFANDDNHYTELVEYLLNVRAGRHYFNPTFF